MVPDMVWLNSVDKITEILVVLLRNPRLVSKYFIRFFIKTYTVRQVVRAPGDQKQ